MKKIKFGVISDIHTPRILFELNKKFYEDARIKFGRIIFIDLSYLINGNLKVNNKEKKYLSKTFDFYRPKNYDEFYDYLKKNRFIFSVSLGRTFKYFKTWYILKKTKQVLFYHLNLGILSSKINFYTRGILLNLKSRIENLFKVKISFIFYRFLVLLKIFPNIDYVFECSKVFANNFYNSPAKKMERFFNIKNLALYQKVIHVNSRAYDEALDLIKDVNEKFITFLDSGFDHPDRERFDKKATNDQRATYYSNLKKILLKLSKLYKRKIIFCSHPKSNTKIIKKHLKGIKVVKYKTRHYILRSKIIFFHESSSALDAMILKKKLWCLKTNTMGKFYESRNNLYPSMINCPSTQMTDLIDFNTLQIKKIINNYDFKLFDKKIRNYLVKNNHSSKYIYKCLKNKKLYRQNKNNVFGRTQILNFLQKFLNHANKNI